MKTYRLIIIALVLCVGTAAFAAYREITFNNRWATGKYRAASDTDNKLRASAITYTLISHGVDEDPGWAWFAGADTKYTGDNAFYRGNYSIRVKVRLFLREISGNYEGPTQSDKYEHLHLSIHPPPQNGNAPDIDDCEASADIDGVDPVNNQESHAIASIP